MTISSISARRALVGAAVAVWVAVLVAGVASVRAYSFAAGEQSAAPAIWPIASGIVRESGSPTLLVFVHPRCPCSRATLAELRALLPVAVQVEAVFLRPDEVGAGWEKTDTWAFASSLPGVRVRTDVGGHEARRFGVHTSGQVLFYDAGGALRFAGGITISRGHEGDNPGRRALAAALEGHAPPSTPVYGCPLETSREAR